MPLHPQAEAFLRQVAESNAPPVNEISVAEARAQMTPVAQPDARVRLVEDRSLSTPTDVPLRLYHPQNEARDAVGGIVYFHGGGWVVGNLDTHDGLCRRMSELACSVVVSVDYRLAPEHCFPAASDDAFAAFQWLIERRDELGVNGPLAVAGDSAGGNLAAATALRARDAGLPLDFQMLIYPVTDCDFENESYRDFADGYFLTRAAMQWFWRQYVGEADWSHPHAAVLRAPDHRGLADAYVLTAEYDPLRTEGERYAAKLADAGVNVTIEQADGMLHGFLRRTDLFDVSLPTMERLCAAFRAR